MDGGSSVAKPTAEPSSQTSNAIVSEEEASKHLTSPPLKTCRPSGATQESEINESHKSNSPSNFAAPASTPIAEALQPVAVGAGASGTFAARDSSLSATTEPTDAILSRSLNPEVLVANSIQETATSPMEPMDEGEEDEDEDENEDEDEVMLSDPEDSDAEGEFETAASANHSAKNDSSDSENEEQHLRKLLLPSAPVPPPTLSSIVARAVQERGPLRERPPPQSQSLSLPHSRSPPHRQSILAHMSARECGDWHAARRRADARTAPTGRTALMGSLAFVQRLQLDCSLEQHDGCVNALSFNERGTLLASGSDDLDVILWDLATQKPYVSYHSGHYANVFQVPDTDDTKTMLVSVSFLASYPYTVSEI